MRAKRILSMLLAIVMTVSMFAGLATTASAYESLPHLGYYEYNGQRHYPQPVVRDVDGTLLVEDRDYRLTYEDNINAGTGYVYVNGFGQYSHISQVAEFTITPENLYIQVDDVYCSVNDIPKYSYTIKHGELFGRDSLPAPSYTTHRKAGTSDYTIHAEFENVPNYNIFVTDGTLYYSGSNPGEDIAPGTVSVGAIRDVYYNGTYQTPKPVVTSSADGILREDVDYTLSYANNKNAGTASVTVMGINNYRSKIYKTIQFDILQAPLTVKVNDVKCRMNNVPDFSYRITRGTLYGNDVLSEPRYTTYSKTGYSYGPVFGIEAKFPETRNYDITVKEGTLTYTDVDYNWDGDWDDDWDDDWSHNSIYYDNGLNIRSISSVTYDGERQTPAVTVYDDNGNRLREDRDYTLHYNNNLHAGTAYVRAVGIGSYRGDYDTASFTIKKRPITVYVDDVTVERYESYTGSYHTSIDLYDGDYLGKETWTLPSSSKTPGDYTITVKFPTHKDYDISVRSGTLTILREGESKNRYEIEADCSSGGSISPSGTVTVVHGNSKTFNFTPKSGYEVSAVYVDGKKVSTSNDSYRFSNVRADHTIYVDFVKRGTSASKYYIDADCSSGGKVSPSGTTSVSRGSSKTFNFTPNSGYEVLAVYVDDEYVGDGTSYKFTNVKDDHELYVEFAKKGTSSSRFDIDISCIGRGSVSPYGDGTITIAKGNSRTFTFTPDSGYVVSSVYVDGKYVSNKQEYTFKNVTDDHTLRVEFAKEGQSQIIINPNGTWVNNFYDVSPNDWFYSSVRYMNSRGLIQGTSSTTFSPYAYTTRGMVITMLYRLEGQPRTTNWKTFGDVNSSDYYYDAVRWGVQSGIVAGFSDGTFRPYEYITREQMAAFLYRYAQYKGYSVTEWHDLSWRFNDYHQISAFAMTPLSWAHATGIINGKTSTTMAPHSLATRAEVSVILTRFCERYSL